MKSDLNDLKKLTLELMKNGVSKVQDINPNLIKKIYGQQEDTETAFEEEPRINVIPNRTENLQEEFDEEEDDSNYLFAETVEEEEVLKLEQKEIDRLDRIPLKIQIKEDLNFF